MHKKIYLACACALFLFPCVTLAHQTQMYEINDVPYQLVIGSLNEPVIVDDKTGVSVEITRNGQPLVGAQENLQVEMIAGSHSKVTSLSPVHGTEGHYTNSFIATVPTTLTYRVFGTLEDTPVDLSFTCNPAGHPQAAEETQSVAISDGVVQTLKRGAFGCPQPKEAFGFPEEAPSAYGLMTGLSEVQSQPEEKDEDSFALIAAIIALMLSLAACAVAHKAYIQKN